MKMNDWKKEGKFVNVFGKNLFVIDKGESKDVIVVLHGYPTSSYDYFKVIERLSKDYRVIIHDHLGFGFSDKPLDYSYSLIEQADYALQLWKQLGLQSFTLYAHDYGTSVATEIIARDNDNLLAFNIKKLILSNGSMHIEMAKLLLIQKLLRSKYFGKLAGRLTNKFLFDINIRKIFFDKEKISIEELDVMWQLLLLNNGRSVIHLLSNYINERYKYWDRWIGALEKTKISTNIIWAENDPIAIKKIALQLAKEIPNNQLFFMEECGHFPMLEKPAIWSDLVLENLI